MKKVKKDVSASEAVYGFMGWLTTRKEVVTLSKSHDCSEAVRLVVDFCRVQGFEKPREGIFPDNLVSMETGRVTKPTLKRENKKSRIKASDLF